MECCICELNNAEIVGAGKDYEYKTSPDTFFAMKCNSCGLVYLNPRPNVSEFKKIYPVTYHALNFSEKEYGLVFKIRSFIEAKRLLSCCKSLPSDAHILDIGCGDGFHLKLLNEYGNVSWTVEGIDIDRRAVENAQNSGLKAYCGTVESIQLAQNSYDLAFMIQTIEHVEKPDKVLQGIYRFLKPGGKLVIITDNTDALDFKLFKKKYWGGYHFPRHWNLFSQKSISKLAEKTNFEVDVLATQFSPVN